MQKKNHEKLPVLSGDKQAEAINKMNRDLLQMCAEDLIPALKAGKGLRHVRQCAFQVYDNVDKESIQVHVLVTRDSDDFLESFQTEEMS